MKRKLIQKSYPGQSFVRPTPEIAEYSQENILLIGTPWGSRESVKQIFQTVREYYGASLNDPEATTPFTRMPGLSPTANNLRISTLLANDLILNKYNRAQYETGCELLLMAFHQSEVSWIQIGQPHILLLRAGTLYTLQSALDLNFDYHKKSPLPSKLLGIERQMEFETKSIVLHPSDKLIFLSRTTVPGDFLTAFLNDMSSEQIIERLFQQAVNASEDSPFWIGVY